jgi:hypothetical protein
VGRRVDLKDAAELLDTTSEAIRKRAKRGSIPSEVGDDGKLYVWVDERVDGEAHRVDDRVDNSDIRVDSQVDEHHKDLLLEHMGSEIDHLREQLREERDANRENRRIIAGLVQRVPELEPAREASPEPRESPVTPSEQQDSGTTSGGDKEAEKRSWWRRVFLGE